MTLRRKYALITGGTGALGSAIAQRLTEEGTTVFASYLLEKELALLAEPLRNRLTLVKADVTDESQVVSLYDALLTKAAHIDIVVNTVGGFLPRKPLTEVSMSEWDLMMNINLKSAFLSTREALRRMQGQPYGRIVNISAMVGLSPAAGRAPYAISKAGVSLLTEIVAQDVKGTGITVNAIAPSIIVTPANLTSMPDEDSSKWVKPEEIADLVCYLCSWAAGAITGTTIKAYGGV
ncbi:MAG: SDR family oxidoreductase [Ignavibacteria bacterium]|nr:SDR family oxidoreductase [Ignavibacteria bacterium]